MASTDVHYAARALPRDPQHSRLGINRLILVLALAVLVVAAASLAAALALVAMGPGRDVVIAGNDQIPILVKFLVKFDMAGEQTVAAWLSSVLMLLCAAVLFHIAGLGRGENGRDTRYWVLLGVIFLGLSMDEMVAFHETASSPMRALVDSEGIFHYPWVILGMAFVGVVALICLGFLFRQPPWFRNRCILAGGIFISGALGFEMMEGVFADFYLRHPAVFELALHLEDTLEFAGLLVFLHALLTYVRTYSEFLSVRLG